MTIRIPGNWKKGFAYDIHTLDSVYLGVDEYGHDRWENTRSEMGELLYDLKYHGHSGVEDVFVLTMTKTRNNR